MGDVNHAIHVLPNSTEVAVLECQQAFEGLSSQEKRYAHHLAQASFKGGLIVLFQTSPESPGIFVLLQKLFRAQTPAKVKELATSVGFSDEEIQAFFLYAAAFYCNMGNYKSFGDTKFIPDVSQDKLEALIHASAAFQADSKTVDVLWNSIKERMFSLDTRHRELGLGEKAEEETEHVLQNCRLFSALLAAILPEEESISVKLHGGMEDLRRTIAFVKETGLQGTSTYYSTNCDENDAKLAQGFMVSKNISPYNTRLFKVQDPESGAFLYEVRIASSLVSSDSVPGCDNILGDHSYTPTGQVTPIQFKVTMGDYSPIMKLVADELEQGKVFASNDCEKAMLSEYVESFKTGSIPCHKDGSRHWIKNKGPIVETYIGFIESYRDPYGMRGEFEGFVAVVNKEMSAKFAKLVESAEKILTHLPWPVEYEKDTFLRPDFTSLDVLGFGGSGIPAGINIPNYDDIRQSEGFKNVSLGNVLTSGYKDTKITFLKEEDKELYAKYKIASFEVQVGLHELLGHGSGKLFTVDEEGKFNFDAKNVVDPFTGEKVKSWYKPGETWDSKFSTIASTYEECRAECVGIFLCLWTDVLAIFDHTEDDADDIIYINWLNMVRAGLLALEFYSPDTCQWRQAHMNARFVILRVLLEAGKDFVRVEKIMGEDQKPDLRVVLDRAQINTVGKTAIHSFLKKLQVYKSTADVGAGRKMYEYYSDVNDHDAPHFLSLRSIVLDRKQPRKLFVQHHTCLEGEDVSLKVYEANITSVIQSFTDRFPNPDIDTDVLNLWEKEKPHY